MFASLCVGYLVLFRDEKRSIFLARPEAGRLIAHLERLLIFRDAGCIGNGNLVRTNVEWDLSFIYSSLLLFLNQLLLRNVFSGMCLVHGKCTDRDEYISQVNETVKSKVLAAIKILYLAIHIALSKKAQLLLSIYQIPLNI